MHKAIFMDRDGTVSEEVGYMYDAGLYKPFPWAGPAVRRVNESGMKAVKSPSQEQRNEWLKNSIMHYKRAVEIYPNHPDAHFNLGVAYFSLGEKDHAIQSYLRAAEVNLQLKDPLKEIGGIYYNDHRNDSALYYFKRVIALDSADEKANEIVKYLEAQSK